MRLTSAHLPTGILAVGFERYGSEEKLLEDAITHLYDVYVKINADGSATKMRKNAETGADEPETRLNPDTGKEENVLTDEAQAVHDRAREFFVAMEAGKCALAVERMGDLASALWYDADMQSLHCAKGDEKALGLWRKFRDLSIVKYKETYARLNIYFDIYSGESQVGQKSQNDALNQLQASGIVTDSKGALIVNLEQYKLGKTIVRKKDGTSVYITRDIGGAAERWEKFKFEKMIYVVASQQDLHLAQVSAASLYTAFESPTESAVPLRSSSKYWSSWATTGPRACNTSTLAWSSACRLERAQPSSSIRFSTSQKTSCTSRCARMRTSTTRSRTRSR